MKKQKKKEKIKNWATFDEERLKIIKDATGKLREVLRMTNYNNRDTQMLEEAIEEIEKVIGYQYD